VLHRKLNGKPAGTVIPFRQGHHKTHLARSWPERFWAKVDREGDYGSWNGTKCWGWTSSRTPGGYSVFHRREAKRIITRMAHVLTYELTVGEIPEGYTIDHLCRNVGCVNPQHLEPVPHGVNLLRGNTVNAKNAAKTHCKQGHEFTAENTYINPKSGCRQCKACQRDASARWHKAKKG
jgi:hypothetical protein